MVGETRGAVSECCKQVGIGPRPGKLLVRVVKPDVETDGLARVQIRRDGQALVVMDEVVEGVDLVADVGGGIGWATEHQGKSQQPERATGHVTSST